MRVAGIDIAAETHESAVVDEAGAVLSKPTPFTQDADGSARLLDRLGAATDLLVVMEATGHYWKNLFAPLVARASPWRWSPPARPSPRQRGPRAHQDRRHRRPRPGPLRGPEAAASHRLPDAATEELREPVRLRDLWVHDFGDPVRQLHRLVDGGFPEFTRYLQGPDTELATAILQDYPTAQAFLGVSVKRLARLC